jgi:hypothetical protein
MTWTEFVYALGDFIESTFVIIEKGGNTVNNFFIVVGFVLFFYWLKKQADYNKEAKEKGTLM